MGNTRGITAALLVAAPFGLGLFALLNGGSTGLGVLLMTAALFVAYYDFTTSRAS